MNFDVYVSHYQQIKEGWGSLTKAGHSRRAFDDDMAERTP